MKMWTRAVRRQPNLPIGVATAVVSLLLLAGIVASAMGQPLVTGQELLSAWGIAQMIAGAMLLLLVGVLSFWFIVVVIVPIRDSALSRRWEQKQEVAGDAIKLPRTAATQEQPATHSTERPIIYNNPANNLALRAAQSKASNLEVLLDSIAAGLSELCYQATGQEESDAVRAIAVLQVSWRELVETKRELEAQLSEEMLEAPQERATASPRGATGLTYESVLALVKAGNVGIKRAQGMVREQGGVVGRDDYHKLQEILSWLPSPTDQGRVHEHEKQTVYPVNRGVNVPRKPQAMGRSQPRKGRR